MRIKCVRILGRTMHTKTWNGRYPRAWRHTNSGTSSYAVYPAMQRYRTYHDRCRSEAERRTSRWRLPQDLLNPDIPSGFPVRKVVSVDAEAITSADTRGMGGCRTSKLQQPEGW